MARSWSLEMGDGRKTRFWHDVWSGNCPLSIKFPHLFKMMLALDAGAAVACFLFFLLAWGCRSLLWNVFCV